MAAWNVLARPQAAPVSGGRLAPTGAGGTCCGTHVRYDWMVEVTKPWVRLIAPLARPLFAWNTMWSWSGAARGWSACWRPRSLLWPEVLVRIGRLLRSLDHHLGLVQGGVAGIAAGIHGRIGVGEFRRAAFAYRIIHGAERPAEEHFNVLGYRALAENRTRFGDIRQRGSQLLDLIFGQRPVCFMSGEPELGVSRLNDEVHQLADPGIERGRGRARRRRTLGDRIAGLSHKRTEKRAGVRKAVIEIHLNMAGSNI